MAISIITRFANVLHKSKATNRELMVGIGAAEEGRRGSQIGYCKDVAIILVARVEV